MLANQNIYIWMAPLPIEFSGRHSHVKTTLPLFLLLQKPSTAAKITAENSKVYFLEINTNNDISDMDLCRFTHDTPTTPEQPSLRKNSKKNRKLYQRSSQSSQIIPGILQ